MRHRPDVLARGLPSSAKRRGAYIVEFAFVAPIFFMLVLGIIEFGRGLMVTQLLTNAARNGCRKAIVGNTTSSAIQTSVTNELSSEGITSNNLNVSVTPAVTSSTPTGTAITINITGLTTGPEP